VVSNFGCGTGSRSTSGCAGPRAGPWSGRTPGRTQRGSGVRGELLAEAAGGPVVTEVDVFGAVLLAEIAAGVAGADTGGHDD